MIKSRLLFAFTLALLIGASSYDAAAQGRGRGARGARGSGPSPTFKNTLKPVTTAETTPDAQGFIPRWVILDPISVGDQQRENASKAAVKTEYFPNQWTVVPGDGDKVTVNGTELTWRAVDTLNYNVNLNHFAYINGKTSDGALFWAVTVIHCPQDMPGVRLAIGSNASSIWWVNGKDVAGIYGDILTVIDDGVSRPLTLKKGANIIRGAIINGSGASDFCARLLGPDEKPVTGFTISAGDLR
jgi:hypothetical protein